ncbi:BQ5605_C011g06642 [Microbotryum silenes-dioicae]|uniref:BQ5605_C011g06642 protein n=1 Tax=Microbotryum silenes-dioicae TaxID=796604 RepID=A0A2X0LTW1_9BASI|nr:BQ5605_C011g06642 [Microbotryum silenes-dioicae]
MADPTLSSPHHHLFLRRASAQASNRAQTTQAPRSHPRLPRPQMAVCIHHKARHWEYERSKSTGHYSTCCSQGKVQLPPLSGPIPNIEIYLKDSGQSSSIPRKRPVAQQRAVFHFNQTRLGTLGLPVFRVFGRRCHRLSALIPAVNQRPAFAQTWLIDPAEATDTLLGPDSPDSRIQRSTLTKLEFNTEMAILIPTPTREIVDRKIVFPRCTVIDVPMVGPSTKSLARSIRLRCLSGTHYSSPRGKMASTPTFLFAVRSSWATLRQKTATKKVRTRRKGTKRTVMTDIECLNTYDEGQVKGVKAVSLAFTNPLRSTCTNATSPHGTRRPFPAFVIERYSQAEADRLNYIQWH